MEMYTFREFKALQDRRRKRDRQSLTGHALVASVIANVHRQKGKKALKPADFLGPEN